MKFVKELENKHKKEQLLEDASKLYSWMKDKIQKGQTSRFIAILKAHFLSLSEFLESNDELIKSLNSSRIHENKEKKRNEDKFGLIYERRFRLFSTKDREEFRKKWNNARKAIWYDHF